MGDCGLWMNMSGARFFIFYLRSSILDPRSSILDHFHQSPFPRPPAFAWSLYTIPGNDSSLGVQRGLVFHGRGATLEGSRGFQPTVPRVI
jgi:hypothetical protein